MSEAFPLLKTRSRPRERRPRRTECKAILAHVAAQPCLVRGCRGKPEVHHRKGASTTAAAGRRSGDNETVPLCADHHTGKNGVHALGEAGFERIYGVDLRAASRRLAAEARAGEMP